MRDCGIGGSTRLLLDAILDQIRNSLKLGAGLWGSWRVVCVECSMRRIPLADGAKLLIKCIMIVDNVILLSGCAEGFRQGLHIASE